MLKVLFAPLFPEDFLRASQSEYRNASELAAAAEVSALDEPAEQVGRHGGFPT
jgi:hypothetical protein